MERLQKRYWKARKQKEKKGSPNPFSGDVTQTTMKFMERPSSASSPNLTPVGEEEVKLQYGHRVAGSTVSDSGI